MLFSFFKLEDFLKFFIYLFLAALVFAAHGLSLGVASGGYSSSWYPGFSLQGLLITVASLIAEQGLYDVRASVVESPRLQKVE